MQVSAEMQTGGAEEVVVGGRQVQTHVTDDRSHVRTADVYLEWVGVEGTCMA